MVLPAPSLNNDPRSCAYSTSHKRWVNIFNDIIQDLNGHISQNKEVEKSGQKILAQVEHLLEDLKSDEPLIDFDSNEIAAFPPLERYNASLAQLRKQYHTSWLQGPWLNVECYLYAKLRTFFLLSEDKHWHDYDVFAGSKDKAFQLSEDGALELSRRYEQLAEQLQTKDVNMEVLKELFKEFVFVSLWGNASDLSLLAGNATLEDIQSMQGAEHRKLGEQYIISNDLEKVWEYFSQKDRKGRVDLVLDNAGFELLADLALALFLLDSKLTDLIHIHCKDIPWFVSDTMIKDFNKFLDQLVDPKFYSKIHSSPADSASLKELHKKLVSLCESGKIVVKSHPYWTFDDKFWSIPKVTDLYNDLLKSDLIILKGDLNYRKLTGDLHWPRTTPFVTAIQELATSKLPLLSLRTCKADVVVGLPEGLEQKLTETYGAIGKEDGIFWCGSGKWAVVSFSSGQ